MSAAKFQDGRVTQLDGRAQPEEVVTPEDVQDPEKLARRLQKAYADIAELRRRWNPRVVLFVDLAVDGTGSTRYRLEHGFGSRAVWSLCRWSSTAGGGSVASFDEISAESDNNTTVLVCATAGTATIRVEEAG